MLYSLRNFTVEPATNENIDTEIIAFLPKNSTGYITSKFKTGEINELFYGKHRLCVEILNRSFEDNIEIKKGQSIGFFVAEPENLKFHHVLCKTKAKKKKECYTPKKKEGR